MSYRIIVDSCGELTDEMKKSGMYKSAPLSMEVNGTHVADDNTFDQARFLRLVAESPHCPRSFGSKAPCTGRARNLPGCRTASFCQIPPSESNDPH